MTCPICKKKSDAKYRPFCSKRCADVDLGKWLKGGYGIAGRDTDEEPAMPRDADDRDPKLH